MHILMCFDAFKEEYLVTYMFASSVPNFSGDVYSKEACVRECVSKYDTEYKQSIKDWRKTTSNTTPECSPN